MTLTPEAMEIKMCDMKEDIIEIKTNHLPHIYDELKRLSVSVTELRGDVKYYIGIAIGGIGLLNLLIAGAAVWFALKH